MKFTKVLKLIEKENQTQAQIAAKQVENSDDLYCQNTPGRKKHVERQF